jgi:predicted nuclease of predicted toxin-antitoxin system
MHVAEVAAGANDVSVGQLAASEKRAIPTFDKDFGDLAVRRRAARSGVVLLRFTPSDPEEIANLVSAALATVGEASDRLIVVERDRVRVRPLPPG